MENQLEKSRTAMLIGGEGIAALARARVLRQHSRTGKVAGTTDTIHHTSTGYVCRVDITEDISLQSRIDRNQT